MIDALKQKLMVDVNVASQFTRAVVGGTRYYSLAYTRVTKRNSYTVCYKDGEVRRCDLIKYFLSVATSQSVESNSNWLLSSRTGDTLLQDCSYEVRTIY